MVRNRIEWIDNVRGFAICMIVLAHTVQYFPAMNELNSYICSFHVSIFFILSGCLAYIQKDCALSFKQVVKKRFMALIIPYIVFSIINFMNKFVVLSALGRYTVDILKMELVELVITGNGTVWFLMTLFGVEIIFDIQNRLLKNVDVNSIVSALLSSVPFVITTNTNPIEVVIKRIFVGLLFYYIGYWFMKWNELQTLSVKWKVFMSILCLISGAFLWKKFGWGISFFSADFNNMASSVGMNVLTSVGWIILITILGLKSKLVTRVLGYMGKHSIIIMLVHPIILMCYVYPIGFPVDRLSDIGQVLWGLAFYIVLLCIHIPIIYVINKHFSWMIGKRRWQT